MAETLTSNNFTSHISWTRGLDSANHLSNVWSVKLDTEDDDARVTQAD